MEYFRISVAGKCIPCSDSILGGRAEKKKIDKKILFFPHLVVFDAVNLIKK